MDCGYFLERKRQREPFSMVTCYDFPFARILDRAGIEIAFVGDSVGTNVLGYDSVEEVTLADMIHHTRAVRRGVKRALLVADLPFGSYRTVGTALESAAALRKAGAEMIKLEGDEDVLPQVKALRQEGYRVMAHIGFKPQYHRSGESIVKGRNPAEAAHLQATATLFEAAGVEMVLMECVVSPLAASISRKLTIPTVGIGSGPGCDGQVLVLHDLLGISGANYRFVREYAKLREEADLALSRFRDDVRSGRYPGAFESFS